MPVESPHVYYSSQVLIIKTLRTGTHSLEAENLASTLAQCYLEHSLNNELNERSPAVAAAGIERVGRRSTCLSESQLGATAVRS